MDGRILLIDDDSELLQSNIRALKEELPGVGFDAATSLQGALPSIEKHRPHVVVLDLCLSEELGVESGFSVLYELKRLDSTIRIIVVTGHGSIESGVRALKEGAASFLEKPANTKHLAALIRDGISQSTLLREHAEIRTSKDKQCVESLLIGHSEDTLRLRDKILYVANSPQSVLITGETGTGKGLVAKLIHQCGPRRAHPFIPYCPNYSNPSLQNSELFGHIRGAYTGAEKSRDGLIRDADKGTLFLDDIDALPQEVQVNLLHVLQERTYRPVGSNQEQKTNFRLISATNQNPEICTTIGKLRLDLYHRIAHEEIHLVPLRDRRKDIEPLARHFLNELKDEEEVCVLDFDNRSLRMLTEAPWQGNVRELQGMIRSAAYKAAWEGRTVIASRDLRIRPIRSETESGTLQERLDFHRGRIVYTTLDRFQGNQTQAAKALGISRVHFRRLLEKHQHNLSEQTSKDVRDAHPADYESKGQSLY